MSKTKYKKLTKTHIPLINRTLYRHKSIQPGKKVVTRPKEY